MSQPIYKLKKLTTILSNLDSFANPKPKLEQYSTSPEIAASILYDIQSRDNSIYGKSVADLGCGPGIFSIGSLLLGAGYVLGFDIDEDAIEILKENLTEMDLDNSCFDVINCNILNLGEKIETTKFYKLFDTVIMNPPFGTSHSQQGADIAFLITGLKMARGHVYSLHKTTTREFVLEKARSMNANAEAIAELKFDIPRSRSKHKKDSLDIKVDLIHSWFPDYDKK